MSANEKAESGETYICLININGYLVKVDDRIRAAFKS